jgi:hypothetical protein
MWIRKNILLTCIFSSGSLKVLPLPEMQNSENPVDSGK